MPFIDPDSLRAIQPELTPNETLLWAARPSPRIVLHKEDIFLIPMSILWGGFAIFWEALVAGSWGPLRTTHQPWILGVLWGIPFVLLGQYLIWGRFLYAVWKKKRTHYAVTTRRVLVVQDGFQRRVVSAYIDTLPTVTKEGGSGLTGTLRFVPSGSPWFAMSGWGVWNPIAIGANPAFIDIEDADSVYRLVSGLREKQTPGLTGRQC